MNNQSTVVVKKKKGFDALSIKKIISLLLIFIVLFITLFPFYIMIQTSLKTFAEAAGRFTWFPKIGSYQGYVKVLEENPYGLSFMVGMKNTLKIVIPSMLVGLIISTMSAYTFAKRDFTAKNFLFWILLVTMMMPGAITMMPQYMMFAKFNWIDTVYPLMIPGMFGSATCVFFMRQFISGLPDSLIEAARVDGLNHFQIFLKIILPLSIPALISQGLLWFLGGYNDYVGPLIYLQDPKNYTVQITLAFFSSTTSVGGENVPAIMAGAILTLLPILVAYACLQKYFISGIAVSGLKA